MTCVVRLAAVVQVGRDAISASPSHAAIDARLDCALATVYGYYLAGGVSHVEYAAACADLNRHAARYSHRLRKHGQLDDAALSVGAAA